MLHRDLLTEYAIAQKSIQTSEGIRAGLFALWTPRVKVTKVPREEENILAVSCVTEVCGSFYC